MSIRLWLRNAVTPRAVFIPFFLSRLILLPLTLIRPFRRRRKGVTRLCIESGIKGWELIEYKELLGSACEYLGAENIFKVAVDRERSYISQVREAVRRHSPTHYVYDPRTGSQKWLPGLREAFVVAWLFARSGVVPIALLTDLPVRAWRAQTAVVTARRGLVVSLMSPPMIRPIFPHARIMGPNLMPLSIETMRRLENAGSASQKSGTAVFAGSLYEPRKTILNRIGEGLSARGMTLEIKARQLGGQRVPDAEYWARLSNASIVITTADQMETKETDWTWIPHLIYRYVEVLACGSLLVAPEVPGIRRFLSPGEHFVAFTTSEDAVEKISYYLRHQDELAAIAERGRKRVKAIVEARAYWAGIDLCLRQDSLT